MNRFLLLIAAVVTVAAPQARGQSLDAGIKLFEAKKYAEAKAFFAPIAGQSAEAAYYMGRIAVSENDDDKATDWFEKATKLNPNSSVYFDWYGRALGNQAVTASKFKLPFLAPKVKHAFEKAVALDPNNLDAREDLIQYYVQAPGIVGGNKQKAREMATDIKRINPYRGGYDLASVCNADKDFACTERELLAVNKAYPDSAGSYTQLAAFYANQKQFDKAWAILDARLKARPDDMNALFGVGRTGALSGQNLDRAEKALKSYIASPPTENAIPPANAHFRLGNVYEKQGKKDLARVEYNTALQLNPKLQDAKKALEGLGR
jgi:tetratricopeptide (TPR) repeat protein